jgi:hypothetical protein
LAKNKYIEKSKLIVFNDSTMSLNALGRTYRDYEWNGLVKVAFGDETRYCIDHTNWNRKKGIRSVRSINKYYLASDYEQDVHSDPLHVRIERSGVGALSFWWKVFIFPAGAFVINVTGEDTIPNF